MAGDWIKMRTDLFTHPKVVRISSALKADRLRTVGGLMSVWCLFDAHSVDGKLEGYSLSTIDDLIGWPGFAAVMSAVGWLDESSESLVLPEFDTHNGQSAKRRAQDADRKKVVRNLSASEADKKRTREEKRRVIKPPIPPEGDLPDDKKNAVAFKTFFEECKAKGEKPIPDTDPVLVYAAEAGIPDDFLWLHWKEFMARYSLPGAKRYKRWRVAFGKSVRGNWFKLWYADSNGQYLLTTTGIQAQNTHKKKAA